MGEIKKLLEQHNRFAYNGKDKVKLVPKKKLSEMTYEEKKLVRSKTVNI
jgi:hypothetical protein